MIRVIEPCIFLSSKEPSTFQELTIPLCLFPVLSDLMAGPSFTFGDILSWNV